MLIRTDSRGILVITQPAHAWLSGQIARAWGNEAIGGFFPREEVCLAAEQHDCGWAAWEMCPTWNARTGLPYHFTEVPVGTHLEVWKKAPRLAAAQNPYSGLLVSMHGTYLYEKHKNRAAEPEVGRFLQHESKWQAEMVGRLERDPAYAPYVQPAAIHRNQRLVAVWDLLSLWLCSGLSHARSVDGVPAAGGPVRMTVLPSGQEAFAFRAEPWPFSAPDVQLVCSARRLDRTFDDEEEMRRVMEAAQLERLSFHLASHESP